MADLWAVGFASGAVLAYEILLLRVFAFSQWHHFASLAVSLALLAFGVAGTTLVLIKNRAVQAGDTFFLSALIVGSVAMVTASLFPQFLTLRPLFAIWDGRELAKMLFLDFAFFIPFYALALAIGQVFVRWPEHTSRLYAANMGGSGLGALAACLLLMTSSLEHALMTVPCVLSVVAAIGAFRLHNGLLGWMSAIVAVLLIFLLLVGPPSLPVSDFKPLAIIKDLPGAEVIYEQPGLSSHMGIVRADGFRSAPGLSLKWSASVPSQDALVLDADRVMPLPRSTIAENLEFLSATLGRIPFVLRDEGTITVIGSGSWLGQLRAPERQVEWVESDSRIIEAFRKRGLPPNVRPNLDYPRNFFARNRNHYSVIFYEQAETPGDAAGEDYTLTVEAISSALEHLESGGIFVIPMRIAYPPRHMPRLLAMSGQALRESGIERPWDHCILLRSMQEGLMMLSSAPFSVQDCRLVREFAESLGFDIAAMPGLKREEANRFHLLSSPIHYDIARTVLAGEGELTGEADWYFIGPAKDDRPYFWRSMKWLNLPTLWREQGRRALIGLDWSLIMLVVKLLTVTAVGCILILMPLGRLPRGEGVLTRPRICLYNLCLGLGFLLLEMAVFQRGTLMLGHPVYSASLVFSVFLVGAGLGSRFTPGNAGVRTVARLFVPIPALSILTMCLLMIAGDYILSLGVFVRLIGLGFVCLPMAFFMGRPFPWGLRRLDAHRTFIPWAWGVNGFASVMSAPLASLLSVYFGQPVTWAAGILCYVLAAIIAKGWSGDHQMKGR